MFLIRYERPEDRQSIFSIHAAAFPTDGEARLVDALRERGELWLSLVAEVGGEVVGHVAFSPVEVNGEGGGVGLAPVAVLLKYRRQGIAERLIRAGIEECKRRGMGFVVVLGEPRYYGRFGFVAAKRWGLHDTYGGGDAFQAMELRDGGILLGGGEVHYASAFSVLD